jgi:hypothetical protein
VIEVLYVDFGNDEKCPTKFPSKNFCDRLTERTIAICLPHKGRGI